MDNLLGPKETQLTLVIDILSETNPESPKQALPNYMKAINILTKVNDPRIPDLVRNLKNLYVNPKRKTHNEFLQRIARIRHWMQDETHTQKRAAKAKLNGLNGFQDILASKWLWFSLGAVSGAYFMRLLLR